MDRRRLARRLAIVIALAAVFAVAAALFVQPSFPPLPYHQGATVRVDIEAPERQTYEAQGDCDVFDAASLVGNAPNGVPIVARVSAFPLVRVGSTAFGFDIELMGQPYMGFPIEAGNGYRDGTVTLEPGPPDRRSGRAHFAGLRSDDGWLAADHDAALSGVVEWRCDGPARTFEPEGGPGG